MTREKTPRISPLERLVLDLLRHGERCGLELVERSGGAIRIGTVYVTLHRMERKGYVRSRVARRRQRYYRMTPYGLRVRHAYQAAEQALQKPTTPVASARRHPRQGKNK